MKFRLILFVFFIAIIVGVKLLGMLNASPIILFLVAFGIAMIVLFVGFTIFAKNRQKNKQKSN